MTNQEPNSRTATHFMLYRASMPIAPASIYPSPFTHLLHCNNLPRRATDADSPARSALQRGMLCSILRQELPSDRCERARARGSATLFDRTSNDERRTTKERRTTNDEGTTNDKRRTYLSFHETVRLYFAVLLNALLWVSTVSLWMVLWSECKCAVCGVRSRSSFVVPFLPSLLLS